MKKPTEAIEWLKEYGLVDTFADQGYAQEILAYIDSIPDGHPYDLILPPAPRVYYANVYKSGIYSDYPNIEDARANRGSFWLALYKITDDGVNATIEVIERNKSEGD